MTLLLLVRHGHTPTAGKVLTGWSRGVHLTERGREQARGARRAPARASPSRRSTRARSSAAERRRRPSPARGGSPVHVRRGLLEVDYGEWTGRSIRQLARTKLWRSVQHTPSSVRFPGGESLRGVQARAVDAVRAIAEEHPGGTVAVVTHADVVRLVLADLAGIHLDLYQRLAVDPASVSAVAIADGHARILKVNDTGDLASLAPTPPAPTAGSRRSPKVQDRRRGARTRRSDHGRRRRRARRPHLLPAGAGRRTARHPPRREAAGRAPRGLDPRHPGARRQGDGGGPGRGGAGARGRRSSPSGASASSRSGTRRTATSCCSSSRSSSPTTNRTRRRPTAEPGVSVEGEGPEPDHDPAVGDARADARPVSSRGGRRRPRTAHLPVLRQPDRPRGSHVPGDERAREVRPG